MNEGQEKKTFYSNRGVERNKRPLQNIVFIIKFVQLKEGLSEEIVAEWEKYKFKDLGFIELYWQYERHYNKHGCLNWDGLKTSEELRQMLGDKQWAKFCNGKREFVVQRRINGKNIPKKKKED